MLFNNAANILDGIPYTSVSKGKYFYDLVKKNCARDILELGFAHGCSTCYFGAAVQDFRGHVDAVDLEESLSFSPSIEEIVNRLGLNETITVHRERSSYTWWLRKKIRGQSVGGACQPCYDLIFIDGPKDWTNDGAAFFMADKLLRPGGLILFDDLTWSYVGHEANKGTKIEGYVFRNMSEEEREIPQIAEVFSLLVTQHPDYGGFEIIDEDLGLARKQRVSERQVRLVTKHSLGYSIRLGLRKLLGRK